MNMIYFEFNMDGDLSATNINASVGQMLHAIAILDRMVNRELDLDLENHDLE